MSGTGQHDRREGSQSLYNLPSTAMRGGDFSELLPRGIVIYDPKMRVTGSDGKITSTPFAGNVISPDRISATAKKFLEFYPTPNLPSTNLTRDYQQAQSAPRNKDFFILRMDFAESANSGDPHSFFDHSPAHDVQAAIPEISLVLAARLLR